jgi:hypothetical protein
VRNRCVQLKQKHTAVQTSISSSDFCQMMGSDSDVIQVGSDKMCSMYGDTVPVNCRTLLDDILNSTPDKHACRTPLAQYKKWVFWHFVSS